MRIAELEKYAKEQDLNVRRLPKYYEVRWTDFTAGLTDAVLSSWRAIMVFCERSEEEQANGFGKLLSNKDNLMLMCLLGDVLFLLKVFQKKLQGDDVTIVDIVPETRSSSTNYTNAQYLMDGKTSFHKATMRKMKHFLGEFCGRKNDARPVEISMFPKPECSPR